VAHIVMVTVGAHGHVNPSLPVLTELVQRGHRVTAAVPAAFAATVASTGAIPLVYESLLPDDTRGQRWPDSLLEVMVLFLDEAQHVLPQLIEAFEQDRPDVMCYDIGAYAARVLAWRWDLPLVQLSPAMVAWDGYEQDMAETLAKLRDNPAGQEYQRRFAGWLQDQGVPLTVHEFTGRPPRCIVLIPRILQPHADRVDPDVYTFVGPCLDARPHQGDWPAPAPDRPLVLVSLGSTYTNAPQLFRDCAAAYGDLGWQVVLAVGRHVDPADLGTLPPGVRAYPWVPQLAVLRYASLFVTHAGMGGCSEGLFAGVPMIAVPQAVDQFSNAEMLANAGVAVVLQKGEVEPAALRSAALALTGSPQIAARCRALARELRHAGGAAHAAAIIVRQLRP
jgi:MGT family glycosyltransferase